MIRNKTELDLFVELVFSKRKKTELKKWGRVCVKRRKFLIKGVPISNFWSIVLPQRPFVIVIVLKTLLKSLKSKKKKKKKGIHPLETLSSRILVSCIIIIISMWPRALELFSTFFSFSPAQLLSNIKFYQNSGGFSYICGLSWFSMESSLWSICDIILARM